MHDGQNISVLRSCRRALSPRRYPSRVTRTAAVLPRRVARSQTEVESLSTQLEQIETKATQSAKSSTTLEANLAEAQGEKMGDPVRVCVLVPVRGGGSV